MTARFIVRAIASSTPRRSPDTKQQQDKERNTRCVAVQRRFENPRPCFCHHGGLKWSRKVQQTEKCMPDTRGKTDHGGLKLAMLRSAHFKTEHSRMAVSSEFSVPSFATTSIVTSASRISPGTIRSLYERATRLRSESVTCGRQKRPWGKGRQGKER